MLDVQNEKNSEDLTANSNYAYQQDAKEKAKTNEDEKSSADDNLINNSKETPSEQTAEKFENNKKTDSEKANKDLNIAVKDSTSNLVSNDWDRLSEIPIKAKLSDNLQTLLRQLNLTENDLTHAGIDLKALEFALDQHIYGKVINFVTTTPIVLSILRWPWVQRSGIKNSQLKFTKTEFSDLTDIDDRETIVTSTSVNEVSKLIPEKNSGIIFTTQGLLLGSQARLKGVLISNAFYEAFKETFIGIWSTLVLSLIAQGTYNYYQYPDERGDSTIWDALGISALYGTQRQYEVALASALNEIYIWPFLVGAPFLSGMINGFYAWWQASIFDAKAIEKTIQKLRRHQPSVLTDGLGWVPSILIPDLFAILTPGIILFDLLPQPRIRLALEKIRNHLIWNGQLSNEQRQSLFDELIQFSKQRTQLTQLKTLAELANIVQGIRIENLKILQEAGIDDETLIKLIKIKTEALAQLRYFAKHYNLPNTPSTYTLRPLLRYIFANYLLWKLGYSEKLITQPLIFLHIARELFFWAIKQLLFCLHEGRELLFLVILFKALSIGIFNIVDNYIEKQGCHAAGKVWLWYEDFDKYICSVCGDLAIAYKNIFTIQDCLQGYLNIPQTLDKVEVFINRFDLSNVTKLDLSAQTIIFQRGELHRLLEMLKPKLPQLKEFSLVSLGGGFYVGVQEYIFTISDVAAISRFIQYSSIEFFYFSNAGPNDDGAYKLIGEVISNISLKVLNLWVWLPISRENIEVLTDGIKNHPTLSVLNLGGNYLNITQVTAIANILPYLVQLEKLNLDYIAADFVDGQLCSILAKGVVRASKLSDLEFDNVMGSACLEAFAVELVQLKHDLSLFLYDYDDPFYSPGYNCDSGVKAFEQALRKNPTPFLKGLRLPSYNITKKSFLDFMHIVPNLKLETLNFVGVFISDANNLTVLIPEVVDILNASLINYFSWIPFDPRIQALGNNGSNLFFSLLPNKLTNIATLDFSSNNISQDGVPAIAEAITNANSGLKSLILAFNLISGIAPLAKKLNTANKLTLLILAVNLLSPDDAIVIGENIKNSNLNYLDVSWNNISNSILAIVKGAQGASLTLFNFDNISITDEGMEELAKLLVTEKNKHPLWINYLRTINRKYANEIPATNLSTLALAIGYTNTDKGLAALCHILPQLNMTLNDLYLDISPDFNLSDPVLTNCGVISAGNKLEPPLLYLYIARFILNSRNLLSITIKTSYQLFANKLNSFSADNNEIENNFADVLILENQFNSNPTIDETTTFQKNESSDFYQQTEQHREFLHITHIFLENNREQFTYTFFKNSESGNKVLCLPGKCKPEINCEVNIVLTSLPNQKAAYSSIKKGIYYLANDGIVITTREHCSSQQIELAFNKTIIQLPNYEQQQWQQKAIKTSYQISLTAGQSVGVAAMILFAEDMALAYGYTPESARWFGNSARYLIQGTQLAIDVYQGADAITSFLPLLASNAVYYRLNSTSTYSNDTVTALSTATYYITRTLTSGFVPTVFSFFAATAGSFVGSYLERKSANSLLASKLQENFQKRLEVFNEKANVLYTALQELEVPGLQDAKNIRNEIDPLIINFYKQTANETVPSFVLYRQLCHVEQMIDEISYNISSYDKQATIKL